MKTVKYLSLAILFVTFVIAGHNPTKSIELQYAKKTENSLKYEIKYHQDSRAEMHGQPMNAEYFVQYPFEYKITTDNHNIKSNITIPKTFVKIITPNGQQILDTRNLKDTRLEIKHKLNGEEKVLTNLDKSKVIDFGMMLGGVLDWEFLFKYTTPSLPSKKVKIGDTWNEKMSMRRIEATANIKSNLDFIHKFVALETIDGRECAKIESQIASKLNDSFDMMDHSFGLEGRLSGKMTWYLDFEEGVIVKLSIEEKSNGKINSNGAGMDATYKQSSVLELNLSE